MPTTSTATSILITHTYLLLPKLITALVGFEPTTYAGVKVLCLEPLGERAMGGLRSPQPHILRIYRRNEFQFTLYFSQPTLQFPNLRLVNICYDLHIGTAGFEPTNNLLTVHTGMTLGRFAFPLCYVPK